MIARISPAFRVFRAVAIAIVLLFAATLIAAFLDAVARASAAAPDAAIDPSMGLAVPAAPALQQTPDPPAAPAAGMAPAASPGRSDGPAAQALPAASELHNPALDPAAAWDDARAARRLGWPAAVFAFVTMLALALGTAGARVPWLAWLARGTAATLLGAVAACGSAAYDTTIAGGTPATIGTALVLTAFAFWQAHRAGGDDAARAAYERYLHSSGGKSLVSGADLPGYDALPDAIKAAWRAAANPGAPRMISRRPERGSASGPLIAILGCAAITVGAMGAWSCSGARRTTTAVKEAVVDCANLTAETRAAEYADRVGAAILAGTAPNGELSFEPAKREIASILADAGLEVAGCAAATAVAHLLYPTADAPRGIAAAPEPSPAKVRDGWEATRAGMLGGRRFVVQIGQL